MYASGKLIQLTAKLNPADTSLTADRDIGITNGRFYFKSDLQEEWISFTGLSASGSYFIYTGLTRGLSQVSNPATAGTGNTWLAGSIGTLVAMHDQIPDTKADNTFQGTNTFQQINATDIRFTGTTTSGLRIKSLTTTQRDALTPATGDKIINSTTGTEQTYYGGTWNDNASGTVANASETVAGKVEIATQTESDNGTRVGGTGAILSVSPDVLQQSITNKIATDAEAIAGSINNKFIVPSTLVNAIYYSIGAFGSGEDGDVVINSGTTTLTRDMYYNNLTVTSPGVLNPNGYKIYIKGTFSGNGTVSFNGNNGSNGGIGLNSQGSNGGTGGAGGVALNQGSLESNIGGSNGGDGNDGAIGTSSGVSNPGGTGVSPSPSYSTTNGSNGGTGGAVGGYPASSGGVGGTPTRGNLYNKYPYIFNLFHPASNITLVNSTKYKGSAGAGGGGGGRTGNYGSGGGGGGGGGGGNGGMIWICAYVFNFTGTISSIGGSGGGGGNGIFYLSGGGGGGGGGNGGILYLISTLFTSIGTTVLTGGTGGAGGVGVGGNNGTAGSNGSTGEIIQITL